MYHYTLLIQNVSFQLYGEPNSPTSESASSSLPPLEPRTNSTPTATETNTPTDTQTDTPTDAKSEEMVVDTENKAQAVEAVSTEKITSNLEERMSDKTNRDEFNAMFHGQDDEEEDDEDMDSMQVIIYQISR